MPLTGKQRVLAAMENRPADRTPWVPFVGVHGGYILDLDAETFLKSAEHLVAGVNKSIALYNPDGIPVCFDLQIEAEVLGCDLVWANEAPPAVSSHPLSAAGGKTLADLSVPTADQGRIAVALEAARVLREQHPDLALYGLITGPFTLALHLMGTDIFMKMFDAVDEINDVMTFCTDVACAMADYYIDAGCDVVASVDPMTSQIGPAQFEQFVTEHATRLFTHIRTRQAKSSFFVCGNAVQNLQAMCDTRPDNLSVDENIPLEQIRDITTPSGISFGGNLHLTTVLLLGTPEDAQRDALACLDTAAGYDNFILAPGCDLPYATPAENLQAIAAVLDDKAIQQALHETAAAHHDFDPRSLTNYFESEKVTVDIITLDSESCTPCQYMFEAVHAAAREFGDLVVVHEHKVKNHAGIAMMAALGVQNIPTTCIDGEIKFVSRIPAKAKLVEAIREQLDAKSLL